jgi:riboflavin synthase
MFTGLVQATGKVTSIDDGRLRLESAEPLGLEEGDSIAVNGVCLTAAGVQGDRVDADVMAETLRRTALGALAPGSVVNLELPLRAGDPLGGHIVQGHVDGTAAVESVTEEGVARVVRVAAAQDLLRYIVEKGSVALDGVSLTVAEVDDAGFSVSLIPETLERTTFGALEPGRQLNVEVDVIAKYVEKLVDRDAKHSASVPNPSRHVA